jgi:hypothetical protein
MKKIEFTQEELTALYWLLTQLEAECDVPKEWNLGSLFKKISLMWDEAK